MNELYLINFLIFSVFATLFIIETGIALLSLTLYRYYRDAIRKYLLPIWEINGTFGGFYLVNFELTYPTLLNSIGQIYITPLLVIGILFIIRSVFLVYSEYINDLAKENLFIKIYAVSTLLMALILISVLSSGVSGIGINIAAGTINLATLLFNPFNAMMILGILLIAIFIVCNLFRVTGLEKFGGVYLTITFLLMIVALHQYTGAVFVNLVNNYYLLLISIFGALLSVILYYTRNRYANYVSVLWLLLSINLFGVVKYPYIFGSADISSYFATQAVAGPTVIITLIGGMLIALSLLYFIYISYIKREEQPY